MGIVGIGRLDRQLSLPPDHIFLLQILVGLLDGLYPGHAQAFDQSILGGFEIPLHSPFGLR